MNIINDFNEAKSLFINTGSKDLYYKLDRNLTGNNEMVNFLINFFNDDYNFILDIILKYTYHTDDYKLDIKYLRLISKANQIMAIHQNDLNNKYLIDYGRKNREIVDCFLIKTQDSLRYEDDKFQTKNSLGFYIIKDNYSQNDSMIVDFFAREFVKRLFYYSNFEAYIHKVYSDSSLINLKDSLNIILDYVKLYDIQLANYLHNHQHMLGFVFNDLERIKGNFDKYIQVTNIDRVEKFNNILENYLIINEIEHNSVVDYIKIRSIIKLNLTKQFNIIGVDNISFDLNLSFDNKYVELEKFIVKELKRIFIGKTLQLEP